MRDNNAIRLRHDHGHGQKQNVAVNLHSWYSCAWYTNLTSALLLPLLPPSTSIQAEMREHDNGEEA
jgi:hypothetical protein